MSDYRTRTPPRGVTSRPYPRDTAEVLKDLGIDARDLAREVRRASPKLREWLPLIGTVVSIVGGFSAVAVKWDRVASLDALNARAGQVEVTAEQRSRALEIELDKAEREALADRLALTALRTETERRLGQLEHSIARGKR